MSVVSNVIFSFSISEDSYEKEDDILYPNMEKINNWLEENNYGIFSVDVDVVSGGRKNLETPLFVAAFNYFSIDNFCNFIKRNCESLYGRVDDINELAAKHFERWDLGNFLNIHLRHIPASKNAG